MCKPSSTLLWIPSSSWLVNVTCWFELSWHLPKISGREQDTLLTSEYAVYSILQRMHRMKMDELCKVWWTLQLPIRSFHFHWNWNDDFIVVIATGLKLEEFPGKAHPDVKQWDAVDEVTHLVPLDSTLFLKNLATCLAGQQTSQHHHKKLCHNNNLSLHLILIFHWNKGIFGPERISLEQKRPLKVT